MSYNIADLYESLVDVIPEREVFIHGDTRLTYAALEERANRLANAMATRGVKAGDHIGLHLFNGPEYMELMLAAFKLRAVPINLNYRYVAPELRYLIDNADLVAVFSHQELAPILAEAHVGIEGLHTLVIAADDSGVQTPGLDALDYAELMASGSPARDFSPRTGEELFIIYTGGTTGMPKGVMWRHEDVFFAGLQGGSPGGSPIESPEELAENAQDPDMALSILPAAPFIHGAAQWAAWIAIFTGGKVVLQHGRSFDAERIWQLVDRERVTTITLVGDAMARPLLDALREPGASYETEQLLAIASAGAVLSPVVRDGLQELLPDAMVLNNFGASETGHQGSAFPDDEDGTDGRPCFYMDESNTVLDEDLKPVTPGSGIIGRLARSGRIPLGYYKDAEKTAERFVEANGQRWVVPGDFATVEEDERITVYGRGAVCINSGGEKVFPEEVEEALKAHPEVFDALVVGIPDPRWMERVAAVVQPRPGQRPSLEALSEHCRKHVAGYKVPRQLSLVEEVARQPSGKPNYKWAKEIAVADANRATREGDGAE